MERTVVMHDPQMVSAKNIQEIIDNRGFDVEVLSTDLPRPVSTRFNNQFSDETTATGSEAKSAITTVAIEGMTCGACTSAVESGFKDVPGMRTFTISLLSERVIIEHDPAVLTVAQITEIIEDRGFGAEVINTVKAAPAGK